MTAALDALAPLAVTALDVLAGTMTARRRRIAAAARRLTARADAWQVAHSPVLLTPYPAPLADGELPAWVRFVVGPTVAFDHGTDDEPRTVGISVVLGTRGLAIHRNEGPGRDPELPAAYEPLGWLTGPIWDGSR